MARKPSGGNDTYVAKHEDGWAVGAQSAKRASSVQDTQSEGEAAGRGTAANLSDGEIRLKGVDGRWPDSDTVAPTNDACPPRDEKH